MIRSVGSLDTTVTAPFAPATIRAAFAMTVPLGEFSVDTPGYGCPAGQMDKKLSGPEGRAVTFSEYALAEAGTPQELDTIGKSRLAYVPKLGGPKAPVLP